MRRWLIVFVFCVGCGETNQQKVEKTLSKANSVLERLTEIDDDGWFKKVDVDELDAWGNYLVPRYVRNDGKETLTVWSSGPDGLHYNKDDVRSDSVTISNAKALAAIKKAKMENRKLTIEEYSSSFTKGLTKGIIQAIKQR